MYTLQLQVVSYEYVNVSTLIRNSMFVLALVASIAVKLSRLCSGNQNHHKRGKERIKQEKKTYLMTTMIRNPYLSPFQSLLIAWGRHISGKASNRKRHSLCKNVRQDKCLTAWFPPMHQVGCMDTDGIGIQFCIRNEVRILRTTK